MEISLPDASQKLIQACGRLIRTETDTGRVALMDKRVLTKRYGRQLLNALPPFRQMLDVQV
jgi:ATP-dependent DNA helicase DinG